MSAIQVFSFQNSQIRTVESENATWFILKDVCDILDIQNPTDVFNRLDDDERGRFNLGRQGEANIINESGLYALILRSNKPNARPFRKWVTSEVLPAIRKTGGYGIITPDTVRLLMENNDQLKTILLLNARITELKAAPKRRAMTQEERERIKMLKFDGNSTRAIAKKLDRAESTVRDTLKSFTLRGLVK